MFILKGQAKQVEDLLVDDYTVVKKREGKEKIEYINLSAGFDTEASSFYCGDTKVAVCYCWQIGVNGVVYLGRTWDEFREVLDVLRKHYELSENRRLVLYVHNLSYDFQWIRRHLEWKSVFARDERKAMKAVTTDGFEFRCSYFYTATSLEVACENLVKYKVKKQVGDLDYNLIRTPKTKLTKKEQGYCIYDVLGVMAIVQEAIEQYGDIAHIPLTNTGKVRMYCREKCLADTTDGRKYRRFIHSLNIDGKEEYDILKRAFAGGFTHANVRNVDKKHKNVESLDFTSSYPTVMISEEYPMSSGKKRTDLTYDEIKSGKRLTIFNAKFIGIREKAEVPDHYISAGKCYNMRKPFLDNGRLISADEVIMTITNVDLDIIDKTYDYDEIVIGLGYTYAKAKLPKALIECILDFYEKKTTLKDVEGEEATYMLFKGMLNSMYGMSVTDIVNDDVIYTNGWGKEPGDAEEQIEKYNKGRNRFLFYPWGVFVTAYARQNLWSGILECGDDYIYSDTDSVKILNIENHREYFDNYNKEIIEKLEKTCKDYDIDVSRISPKTIKGKEKPLGVWDKDGSYKSFKTLGSKRYLVEYFEPYKVKIDGKEVELTHKCTVAGVNKFKTSQFIEEKFEDPFGAFTNNLTVDEEHSGRLISTYLDEGYDVKVVDYQGICYNGREESGIHMERSEYHLTMTAEYLALVLGAYISEDGII